MARSQSSAGMQFVKWAGAAAAAVVGGVAIGYLFFGNARVAHPPEPLEQPPVSATLAPSPAISPSTIHPRVSNGNYTAPGAPHIVIEEERQPILHRVTPAAPRPDPEATQEAAAPTAPPDAGHATPAGAASTPAGSAGPASTPASAPDTNSGSSVPSVSAPPATPADPDFEHVNTGVKPAAGPGTSDPESGQQGGQGQGSGGQSDSGKSQFRVQTGAYTDESNARSIADLLRSQGYVTSTRSERDGDHLVYKVQIGAYRSKNGADKAADDLQKKGYPAFISPISP